MHAFKVLADPVRRRILEFLVTGGQPSGKIAETIMTEFGISQPGVSQHLKILRNNGFTSVIKDGPLRIYSVIPEPLRSIDLWLDHFRRFWDTKLDALTDEIERGKQKG